MKKYRYPRHRQNINTKHPRQKKISRHSCATMKCPSESRFALEVPNAPTYLPKLAISCISLYRLNESPFSSRVDVRVRRHFDEVSCRYPRTLYHCEFTTSNIGSGTNSEIHVLLKQVIPIQLIHSGRLFDDTNNTRNLIIQCWIQRVQVTNLFPATKMARAGCPIHRRHTCQEHGQRCWCIAQCSDRMVYTRRPSNVYMTHPTPLPAWMRIPGVTWPV